jgi:hypothetical protein
LTVESIHRLANRGVSPLRPPVPRHTFAAGAVVPVALLLLVLVRIVVP